MCLTRFCIDNVYRIYQDYVTRGKSLPKLIYKLLFIGLKITVCHILPEMECQSKIRQVVKITTLFRIFFTTTLVPMGKITFELFFPRYVTIDFYPFSQLKRFIRNDKMYTKRLLKPISSRGLDERKREELLYFLRYFPHVFLWYFTYEIIIDAIYEHTGVASLVKNFATILW